MRTFLPLFHHSSFAEPNNETEYVTYHNIHTTLRINIQHRILFKQTCKHKRSVIITIMTMMCIQHHSKSQVQEAHKSHLPEAETDGC